jgi:drug/metabolite transporter (DMT)-like permease
MKNKKNREYLAMGALILVTIVWGWGFVFSNMALEAGLRPGAIMFARFTLAALLMGIAFRKSIRANYQSGQWKSGLLTGGFLFLGFFIQILGLERSTPSNNAFITGAYVVMVPFILWIVLKKKPKPVIFFSSFLSLGGVAVLSVNPSGGFSMNLGDILTLISALFFALQIVSTGVFASSVHHLVLVFTQFTTAAILSLALFLLGDRDFSGFASPQGTGSVLFLGICSTFLCYFLQTYAQRFVASSKAGIIMGMEALFGTLFSVSMGYDQPNPRMFFGGIMMLTSIILPEFFAEKTPGSLSPG